MKTFLPSLKQRLKIISRVECIRLYKCSSCDACYVGQTSQHLITCIKGHANSNLGGAHFCKYNVELLEDNISIITSVRIITQMMMLEALATKSLKPILNRKDKYRMRTLSIEL